MVGYREMMAGGHPPVPIQDYQQKPMIKDVGSLVLTIAHGWNDGTSNLDVCQHYLSSKAILNSP